MIEMRSGFAGGWTLSIETTTIDVTPLAEPDPSWSYTDDAGHEHYYDDGYPTLQWVEGDPVWCEDCHDHHAVGWRCCRRCGERVNPTTRTPPARRRISGQREAWVESPDGLRVPVGEEFLDGLTSDNFATRVAALLPDAR